MNTDLLTRSGSRGRTSHPAGSLRVGFFGLLGAGNIGNDASFEAMLDLVATERPDAVLGCLCSGPHRVTERYAIPATALRWFPAERWSRLLPVPAWKALGKVVDAARTLRWLRRFDVVIVPGAGVLETTLPLRPWGFPYALSLLCACARITGTRVGLVNVGANVTNKRLTRLLFVASARLAHYRSFRDIRSRDALGEMGLDTSADDIYPDLALALPSPEAVTPEPGSVGVGVMAFHGGDDDRGDAERIHAQYVRAMREFVHWLARTGRRVRLFTGDTVDEEVAEHIRTAILTAGDIPADSVVTQPFTTLYELQRCMSAVDTVVATRYHNVLCALKLAKPALSVSYSAKSDDAMARWGRARFCHPARAVDVDRLIEQFTELERHAHESQATMAETTAEQGRLLCQQRTVLSATLFDTGQETATREAACEQHH